MKQLEMVISSVESYSHIKGIPANKVFAAFASKGVLSMLLESYEVFQNMDAGFLVGVIDGYVQNTVDADECEYNHYEERKKVLPEVVRLIQEQNQVDELKALELFYLSQTGEKFSEDATGLYAKSAKEIFAQYQEEQ